MKKSDLRSGMLVTLRNGKPYYVMLNTGLPGDQADVLIHIRNGETCWMPLSEYDEDLTYHDSKSFLPPTTEDDDCNWDIVRVRGTVAACYIWMPGHYKTLWKREELNLP